MSPAEINGIAFLGFITLIVFSFCLWLRSKRGQRWVNEDE
jgi:hypothetical protein